MKYVKPVIYLFLGLFIRFVVIEALFHEFRSFGTFFWITNSRFFTSMIFVVVLCGLTIYFFRNTKDIMRKIPLYKYFEIGIYILFALAFILYIFLAFYIQSEAFETYLVFHEILTNFLGLALLIYAMIVIGSKYTDILMKIIILLLVINTMFINDYVMLNLIEHLKDVLNIEDLSSFYVNLNRVVVSVYILLIVFQSLEMVLKSKKVS